MEAIYWAYLLAAGIIMIGLEALVFSFFLVWLGVGFVIVAALSYIGLFDSGIAQIATAVSIGLVLLFALRKWSMKMINKSEDDSEEKPHKGGVGIVDNGMIKLDGTFWQCDDDLSAYKDGERVEVVIINNKAKLASQ
jgi:membrane protein implicated in regulation of membrane protease activity